MSLLEYFHGMLLVYRVFSLLVSSLLSMFHVHRNKFKVQPQADLMKVE